MKLDTSKWRGKKVLVTGHTGFKGSWLCLLLHRLGAEVYGLSLPAAGSPNLYSLANISGLLKKECLVNLAEHGVVQVFLESIQPEVVMHLAAQPIVVQSFKDPVETFTTNINGTINLLEACRNVNSVRAIVSVTSDKCYLNEGGSYPFRENDPLGGSDPYSASKACAEIVSRSYAESFLFAKNIQLNTVRAGNIIGGGDWGANRIIPDIIRAIFEKKELIIRAPQGIRPWQHVLDAITGYLLVAERLMRTDQQPVFEGWNFGPDYNGNLTVQQLLDEAKQTFPALSWKVEPLPGVYEAKLLSLDSTKARRGLNWTPRFDLMNTVKRTFSWYGLHYQNMSARELCLAEIDETLKPR